ncbi:hypothetical protein [Caudoviricetes sp.]|nr:hypothetical protein [Caudoviricetes sp.]
MAWTSPFDAGGNYQEMQSVPFAGSMSTATGGAAPSGGGFSMSDFSNYAVPIANALGSLGSAFSNSKMMQDYARAMGATLPNAQLGQMNMDELSAALANSKNLTTELTNLTPNPLTLRAAANASARNSAAHGVTGPLAASMGQSAENEAYSLWDQWRRQMLINSNDQYAVMVARRQQLMEQQWQQELARRKLNAMAQAAMTGETDALVNAFGSIVGAIGGGIMGGNPMMGAQIGGAASSGMWGMGNSAFGG